MRYKGIKVSTNVFRNIARATYRPLYISIHGIAENGSARIVGRATVLLFETNSHVLLITASDEHSNDARAAVEALLEYRDVQLDDMYSLSHGYAVLERMFIEPEYRANGIGTKALKDIMAFLWNMNIHLVVVNPYPIALSEESTEEDIKNGVEILRGFYSQCLFRPFDDTNPHMVADLSTKEAEDVFLRPKSLN